LPVRTAHRGDERFDSRDIVVLRYYEAAKRLPGVLPQYAYAVARLHRALYDVALEVLQYVFVDLSVIFVKGEISFPYIFVFVFRRLDVKVLFVLPDTKQSAESDAFEEAVSVFFEAERLSAVEYLVQIEMIRSFYRKNIAHGT
jgi:hypothetical protein